MTDREPDAEELAKASDEAEVEAHAIVEDADAESEDLTINFGCKSSD